MNIATRSPAQEAFLKKNPAASREFHNRVYDEPHKTNKNKKIIAQYFELCLEGALKGVIHNGIMTTVVLALVNGSTSLSLVDLMIRKHFQVELPFLDGSHFSIRSIVLVLLLLQFGIMFGMGLASACSEYFRRVEYAELYESEKRREMWECENYIEGEQKEMVQLYVSRGINPNDAETIVQLLSKNKKLFVEVMMKEELELISQDENLSSIICGIAVGLSYILGGLLPSVWLVMRAAFTTTTMTLRNTYGVYYLLLFATLSLLGVGKTWFNVNSKWRSSFQILITSSAMIILSFFGTTILGSALTALL